MNLVEGPRVEYLKTGVPLYDASIKCDWKAANAILVGNRELVRYSITENGETALHVAASAKGDPKLMVDFVKNLIGIMTNKDLELQNKNHNTALYLAVVAGNVETLKIMLERNEVLLTIAGAKGDQMPLYAAVLFGHYEVVKYLYEKSRDLSDDGWETRNRSWLLEKCVENNIFDIALRIVEKYPELASNGKALGGLARKPDAFSIKKTNFFLRIIIWVLVLLGLKNPEKENKALPLLKFIWKHISNKPKNEIDDILRGPADSINKKDKSASGRVVQFMQLQKLIFTRLDKLYDDTQKIFNDPLAASLSADKYLQLKSLLSEYVVNIHLETQNIIKQDKTEVSTKGDEALQKFISEQVVSLNVEMRKIAKRRSRTDEKASDLKSVIYKHIKDTRIALKTRETGIAMKIKEKHSDRVLFIAAEMGNTIFLVELIRGYPDLIWKVDDNNQTIFHIAVKHRHAGIYNLLYEIGAMKDMITPLKDEHDNNMLHLVGKSAKRRRLQDVSGVALQMQRELLWFQEVETMIPPSYRERKNEDDLTPHELFAKEHKELVTQGEKWMKGTASQCMVVAALIATIVFAAAFTVPGGYNQNTGIPIFHSEATFVVFVVADAISLFTSSASILMFLSILTSRYAERDFLKSLPTKLILGLVTLFLSITTMTVAFSVSFFVLYHKGCIWIPVLIGACGLILILIYVMLVYGLFIDVIHSTYGSRYLFKPKKHLLYYENPKI